MFSEKTFEQRMISWADFRKILESAVDPLDTLCNKYNSLFRHSNICNPWSRAEWPSPWELICKNQYCGFTIVLGMCYTLMHTNRFSHCDIDLMIIKNNQDQQTKYLAKLDSNILGYPEDLTKIHQSEMPASAVVQHTFTMNKKR